MNNETRRILDLLSQNKVTVEEADQLLRAIAAPSPRTDAPPKVDAPQAARKPRFIRIAVHKTGRHGGEKDVNIRVPLAIIKSGLRLGAIIPPAIADKLSARLRERALDVDFSKLDPDKLESALCELGDVGIDVDSTDAQVKITCE